MDQEQPAAICGRAVLENIVNNGKAHSHEWSRQRAIALTMNVGGGGGWGACLPHLSSARLYYLGSSKNRWKSVLERMDRGCLGFGERLEIDQANGGEGRKPRPWASGQKVKLHGVQRPECCRLPPSSVFCPTHGPPSVPF